MLVSVSKETEQKTFSIEASGIKTVEDVKEVIRQCQLVEGQITDGLERFSIDVIDSVNTVKVELYKSFSASDAVLSSAEDLQTK